MVTDESSDISALKEKYHAQPANSPRTFFDVETVSCIHPGGALRRSQHLGTERAAAAMDDRPSYSTMRLRNGCAVEIRAFQPDDRQGLLAAIGQMSPRSLYRRFFGFKRSFTNKEIAFFTNVDFTSHVALVATVDKAGERAIVAGARYVMTQPGQAEVAFMVIDRCQGQGIGAALMQQIIGVARRNGLRELTADVLPDNGAMLKIFERCGLALSTKREAGAVHVSLPLA